MPKPKSVETGTKVPDTCILKMGNGNNVIQWSEEMYNITTDEVGGVGTHFYTNVAYQHPYPHERKYNPIYVEPAPKRARTTRMLRKTTTIKTMSKRTSER
jgi:hypothetical protein